MNLSTFETDAHVRAKKTNYFTQHVFHWQRWPYERLPTNFRLRSMKTWWGDERESIPGVETRHVFWKRVSSAAYSTTSTFDGGSTRSEKNQPRKESSTRLRKCDCEEQKLQVTWQSLKRWKGSVRREDEDRAKRTTSEVECFVTWMSGWGMKAFRVTKRNLNWKQISTGLY